jgi:hypothetical protein
MAVSTIFSFPVHSLRSKTMTERWRQELGGRPPGQEDLARLQTLVDEECDRLRNRREETVPIATADLFPLVRQHYERLERERGAAPTPADGAKEPKC